MLVSFLLFLVIFLVIVEIFCVLFKLTGLTEDKARFQVVSLLTGTGYTTRESELITQHPTRRRLAQLVMMLGYFGIATFISFVINIIKSTLHFYDILLIIVFIIIMIYMVKNPYILAKIDAFIVKVILKEKLRRHSHYNIYTLLKQTKGYGLYNILIDEESFLVGMPIKYTDLKKNHIKIINIDKGDEFIPFPEPDYVICKGDSFLVYGKTENIVDIFKLR